MYDLKVNYAFMPHNREATNQLLAILVCTGRELQLQLQDRCE